MKADIGATYVLLGNVIKVSSISETRVKRRGKRGDGETNEYTYMEETLIKAIR